MRTVKISHPMHNRQSTRQICQIHTVLQSVLQQPLGETYQLMTTGTMPPTNGKSALGSYLKQQNNTAQCALVTCYFVMKSA
jgi:hypothetical protein